MCNICVCLCMFCKSQKRFVSEKKILCREYFCESFCLCVVLCCVCVYFWSIVDEGEIREVSIRCVSLKVHYK